MERHISLVSAKSLFLQMGALGTIIGTATGFVAEYNGKRYLITNRHVVRGRHNGTGEVLDQHGATPDEMAVLYPASDRIGSWKYCRQELYSSEGKPLWLEHPKHGGHVDVVAIPIKALDGEVTAYPHDVASPGAPMMIRVGVDLFVIGFPFGRIGVGGLGIWVRGSVATDPDLDHSDLPSFLIDSRTREGSSGSPVVAYAHGGPVLMEDGSTRILGRPAERLVGVYSGRVHRDSDLGVVWKLSALQDILSQGVVGSN